MPLESWLLYVATVLALMITPGPSQLLMLSNSASYGFKRSLATACGDLTANSLQMLAAGFGLATILTASEHILPIIKWLGVAYLVWMGVRKIRSASAHSANGSINRSTISTKTLWLQGFLTSAANPKAVVFFAALFPLFIAPNVNFATQFVILSITYLVIDGMFLSMYGGGASWVAKRYTGSSKKTIEQLGGGFMIVAAVLLGIKSIDAV